ncbi:MAG: hypothetical protein KKH98_10260 [Spirochaetes bacterium]|nr:hypothetical protein [Spirochaetota bacterium]
MITAIDFAIIFAIIFFINTYLLSIKVLIYKDLKLKFKYDKLKDNIGYVFTVSLKNTGEKEIRLPVDNKVNFFIQTRIDKMIIWEKHIDKPSFPLSTTGSSTIRLKKEDLISYTYIFDIQNEPVIPENEYYFGVNLLCDTNRLRLDIPASTKPKKGMGNLFK